MDTIKIKSAFIAVFDKKNLDNLVPVLKNLKVKVLGTVGTVKYLKAKGINAKSVLTGFDFDGRVKSLDRAVFARILADRTKKNHLDALSVIARSTSSYLSVNSATKQSELRMSSSRKRGSRFSIESRMTSGSTRARTVLPMDAVVVDLYKPDKKGFLESMDIGGQALIRAAIKNFQNVAVAFDAKSIDDLAWELKTNKGETNLTFRKKQATKALKFIASRSALEVRLFLK